MAIQVLITLNISLDRSDLVDHRSTIIGRLNEIIVDGLSSDWLSISFREGHSMTQIYRYIVRSAASDSKATQEMFQNVLPSALSSLAVTINAKHESNACIAMELGEYYLLNADFSQANALLAKANALFSQHHHSETLASQPIPQDGYPLQHLNCACQNPHNRISKSRLAALLRAAGHRDNLPIPDNDAEGFVARLLDLSCAYPAFTNPALRSLWNFVQYSTPINVDALAQEGVSTKYLIEIAQKVVDDLNKTDVRATPSCHRVERLQMWIQQVQLLYQTSTDQMTIETDPSANILDAQEFTSAHSRTDLIERIEFAFMRNSESQIPVPKLSGKGYVDIMQCAIEIEQKHPANIVRLLLDSDQSSITERFLRTSPTTAFSVAALLSSIANNLQPSPLNIEMKFYGGEFSDVKAKRFLSKFKIPSTVLRSRLLKYLRGALTSSLSTSPDVVAHLKVIATVLYAESEFALCVQILLTIIRISSMDTFLNNPVLTDHTYFEMLITSLSQIGEFFHAAVFCQLENFLDLERGSRLLMTSPRRFQADMFSYILYPELVEALVYAYDKISPDNNKKQAALNLMSRPIMAAKRSNPDRIPILSKFVTNMLLNPKYSSHEHSSLIV